MEVGIGYYNHPDTALAAREAVSKAFFNAKRTDTCDFVLLFYTARHNAEILHKEVLLIVGKDCPVYGGGAAGIITNNEFGYAGDQVGVALVWTDGAKYFAAAEHGLARCEQDAGERLGKKLKQMGIKEDSPVMFFYDAISRSGSEVRLLMATWLLEGIEKGLGFLPDLFGAGMQGDHICSPTMQFTGAEISTGSMFALAFSDSITVDHIIMHGCRPASGYYTVTKAEGSVILEINGEKALPFLDKLLGPSLKPEDYPFFLLFGINYGAAWEYDENDYASRLCLGIDVNRGGIVMFEPDMVEGTKFQIMFRSIDLDYMTPKIEEMYKRLEDKEPVFAMYIDCAGRCAGYGGTEMEDAYVIQKAANKLNIPLLGLYTGVEIASIGGQPRGLDWTGVFCVFSKNKDGVKKKGGRDAKKWNKANAHAQENKAGNVEKLTALCAQNVAKILSLDVQSIALRHELEQKRRGFALLAEFSINIINFKDYEDMFVTLCKRINSVLNMQKTVVLLPDTDGNYFPSVLQGYNADEKTRLTQLTFNLSKEFFNSNDSVIVTGASDENYLSDIRKALDLPYFIAVPIAAQNQKPPVLLTGRMTEAPPFLSRLGVTDVETLQAIGTLLSLSVAYKNFEDVNKLAQSDMLTGLYNRRFMEGHALQHLKLASENKKFVFILIDIDLFKNINDTYGHLIGDKALVTLANMLKENFRNTDIIARLGGDEFAIFCPSSSAGVENLKQRLKLLLKNWSSTPIQTGDGREFYSTLSAGVSIAPDNGADYTSLVETADIALYKSKNGGRNRFTVYSSAMKMKNK